MICDHFVQRIDGSRVTVFNIYVPENTREIEADWIVMATGRQSDNALYGMLHGVGNGPGDTYDWHEHGTKRCCIACAAGSCPHHWQRHRPWPGRHDDLPPRSAHPAPAGAEGVRCIEAPRRRD